MLHHIYHKIVLLMSSKATNQVDCELVVIDTENRCAYCIIIASSVYMITQLFLFMYSIACVITKESRGNRLA